MPSPEERVALIDLDGTIIDNDYEITCSHFTETVKMAQRLGWRVGLSSDTPYEAMCERRDEFSMNGPIIAEKGAVVEDFDGTLHFDSSISDEYASSKAAIREYFFSEGVTLWEGNPVAAIRTRMQIGNDGEVVALLSNERRCSLAVFLRRASETGLELGNGEDLMQQHIGQIRELYPTEHSIFEDLNTDYGLLIVSDARANKRVGTQKLQQLSGIGRIAMIGNSAADYVGSDIAAHYAVQDATPEFSALADYTASHPLTRGVTEILSELVSLKQ